MQSEDESEYEPPPPTVLTLPRRPPTPRLRVTPHGLVYVVVCHRQPKVTLCLRCVESPKGVGYFMPAPGERVISSLAQYIGENREQIGNIAILAHLPCSCWEDLGYLPYKYKLNRFNRIVPVSDELKRVFAQLERLCGVDDAHVRANTIGWERFGLNMLLQWERHERLMDVAAFPRHGSVTAEHQVEGTRQYGQKFFLDNSALMVQMAQQSPHLAALLNNFRSITIPATFRKLLSSQVGLG
ncbi:hypothetical protein B0H67DRAFT_558090 [Lasiosphaeris hirsuta]|uniref:Uncharacterized protein n=1 Tax=Lasiosphaeris hirsuta TaxID=260670 RepID=A0AA39ZXJ9_9PEZI|nr:hypothetical protein B0H67DRAFT_558090 [Lasiosphaeris hirsuta]